MNPEYMHEFIGHSLNIREAPGLSGLPVTGEIVDETMNMLYLERADRPGVFAVAKRGLVGAFSDVSGATAFIGDAVRVRPEDRIKRFAPRRRNR